MAQSEAKGVDVRSIQRLIQDITRKALADKLLFSRLPESTVRHAFALYQLPSTEEGFADVQIVAADAPLDAD